MPWRRTINRVNTDLRITAFIGSLPILALVGIFLGDPAVWILAKFGVTTSVLGTILLILAAPMIVIGLFVFDETEPMARGWLAYVGFVCLGGAFYLYLLPGGEYVPEQSFWVYGMTALAIFLLTLSLLGNNPWLHRWGTAIAVVLLIIGGLRLWWVAIDNYDPATPRELPSSVAFETRGGRTYAYDTTQPPIVVEGEDGNKLLVLSPSRSRSASSVGPDTTEFFPSRLKDAIGDRSAVIGNDAIKVIDPEENGGVDSRQFGDVAPWVLFFLALIAGIAIAQRKGGTAKAAGIAVIVVASVIFIEYIYESQPSPRRSTVFAAEPPPAPSAPRRVVESVVLVHDAEPVARAKVVDSDDLPRKSRVPLTEDECPERLSEPTGPSSDPLELWPATHVGRGTWRRGDANGILLVSNELWREFPEGVEVTVGVQNPSGRDVVHVKVESDDELRLCPDTGKDKLADERGESLEFTLTFSNP